ncbi:hypothetical protein [Peribacillus frigoritolerans]|uniref:hypothetical protein n=1 Tax=Peribacillus frigoritolerans TaxID=450367 RepID=UPI002EB93771|nr:hypothetical protein [Peribacillus frigoritolerans]
MTVHMGASAVLWAAPLCGENRKDAVVLLRNSMFRMASARKRFLKGFVRTLFDSRFPGKEGGNEAGVSHGWMSNLLRWIWIRESDF